MIAILATAAVLVFATTWFAAERVMCRRRRTRLTRELEVAILRHMHLGDDITPPTNRRNVRGPVRVASLGVDISDEGVCVLSEDARVIPLCQSHKPGGVA